MRKLPHHRIDPQALTDDQAREVIEAHCALRVLSGKGASPPERVLSDAFWDYLHRRRDVRLPKRQPIFVLPGGWSLILPGYGGLRAPNGAVYPGWSDRFAELVSESVQAEAATLLQLEAAAEYLDALIEHQKAAE